MEVTVNVTGIEMVFCELLMVTEPAYTFGFNPVGSAVTVTTAGVLPFAGLTLSHEVLTGEGLNAPNKMDSLPVAVMFNVCDTAAPLDNAERLNDALSDAIVCARKMGAAIKMTSRLRTELSFFKTNLHDNLYRKHAACQKNRY